MRDVGLVDTNVLVYAHDGTAGAKHDLARTLLRRLWPDGKLVYSVQVLNEFYRRATKPGVPPSLPHEEALNVVQDIASSCVILPITASVVMLAIEAVGNHQLALWDALIWAVAKENGITLIYTEDVPGKDEIEGVRYENPFTATA